jgi:hypothetical protein
MKKGLLALLAILLVLFGVLLPLVMPRSCRINRAAAERIKEGMTQAEVHAILGPPGDYRTRPSARVKLKDDYCGPLCPLIEEWEGDEGTIRVDYHPFPTTDEDELVLSAYFMEADPYHPGLVELVCWRLKRLTARWLP